jgi:inner membrane transporter RhtA
MGISVHSAPKAATQVTRVLDRMPAPALALGGVASLQCGAAVATRLFPAVGVAGVVALRLTFGAIVLCVWWRPRLHGDRRTWGLTLVVGSLLAAHHLSYYQAIDRIPLGVATTIEFLGPLAIALAGARHRRHVAWALLAALGVIAVARPGGHLDWPGVLYAGAAGTCWAGYITVSATLTRRVGDSRNLAPAMAWGALICLPYGIIQAGPALLRPRNLLLGLVVSLLSSVLSYSLQMDALRRMPRRLFSILASLEPAIGALIGLAALGQRLTALQGLGMAAVVFASIGAASTAKPPRARASTVQQVVPDSPDEIRRSP